MGYEFFIENVQFGVLRKLKLVGTGSQEVHWFDIICMITIDWMSFEWEQLIVYTQQREILRGIEELEDQRKETPSCCSKVPNPPPSCLHDQPSLKSLILLAKFSYWLSVNSPHAWLLAPCANPIAAGQQTSGIPEQGLEKTEGATETPTEMGKWE